MKFKRYLTPINEDYRHAWVENRLGELAMNFSNGSLLDVGAGSSPYRRTIVELGYKYFSHDFNAYVPQEVPSPGGLQNDSWSYHSHDFVCDILEIPTSRKYDLVLCTEVLEHVPDPVGAFNHMVSLLKPGGVIIVTVPFMSLMHQAPYWFQSGLSPFWFEYWSEKNLLTQIEIAVFGDYVDFLNQELTRAIPMMIRIKGLRFMLSLIHYCVRRLRNQENSQVISSGGFGTLFIGKLK